MMVNDSKSGNALSGFVEKIDFNKLNGTPEDFYKTGLAFIENGQFDDGIQEFVKVVKTASIDNPLFGQAVKELKSMGFSGADISTINSISESEIERDFVYVATQAKSNLPPEQSPFSNNFFKFFFGGGAIIFLGIIAMFILSFLVNGKNGTDIGTSFIGAIAFIIGQFLFVALVIYLVVYGLMSVIRSKKK